MATERLRPLLQRLLPNRPLPCMLGLGVGFLVFGVSTLQLAALVQMVSRLVLEHGWQALSDGAAQQLLELLVSAYLGLAGWLLFKVCETRLLQWLLGTTR